MRRKNPIAFTPEGFAEKQREQEALEARRLSALEELNTARELGDRSENGAYKAARWKLAGIDRQLRHLRDVLSRAQVQKRRHADIVEIGATVELDINGTIRQFRVVGPEESTGGEGTLSIVSPIGRAIANRKAGEQAVARTPAGEVLVSILRVA